MSRAFEIIGDIAVIGEHAEDKKEFANKILERHKNLRAVYVVAGKVKGVKRIRPLKFVAGKKGTVTVHRENNCVFKMDLKKAYFSARLSSERKRVSEKIKDGERVLDMFAGVGPFSIQAAKKGASVVAVDINKDAYKYLLENMKLNKVEDKIDPYCRDVRKLLEFKDFGEFDKIIMNAPKINDSELLELASSHCKCGGIIFFYIDSERVREIDFLDLKIAEKRRVAEYAPGKVHYCYELVKE